MDRPRNNERNGPRDNERHRLRVDERSDPHDALHDRPRDERNGSPVRADELRPGDERNGVRLPADELTRGDERNGVPLHGDERRRGYERDGFLVLPGFIEPAACDALIARAGELVRGFSPETISIFTTHEQTRRTDDYFLESGDKIRFFFEEDAFTADGALRRPVDQAINKIGHALHDLDPVFSAFSRSPRLADLVGALGTAQPLLLQSMYIFKQPFIGGEVTAHQDHTFLWTDPPSATGLWFALEDATLDNGCLWALPGGHAAPARKRFHRLPDGRTGYEVFDPRDLTFDGMVPLPAPKGTCIVLHGLLPHYSAANRSPHSRQAYTLHVIDAAATYRADNWLQRGPDLPLRGFEPLG